MSANGKNGGKLYEKIADYIREKIGTGELRIGEAIYSESQLCDLFGASRTSVRKAIRMMVADNLLVSQQGKGTFVRQNGHGFLHDSICLVNHWSRFLRYDALDSYLRDIVGGVETTVRERDITFQVFSAPLLESGRVADGMRTVKVDGLVLDCLYLDTFEDLRAAFAPVSPHMVMVDGNPEETTIPAVVADSEPGFAALLELATERKGPLAFVYHEHSPGQRHRLAAFRRAAKAAGALKDVVWLDYGRHINPDSFHNLDHYCLLFRVLEPFLEPGHFGATLLCVDDYAAVKAMKAIRRAGYGVPTEFAVGGFGGLGFGEFVDPELTTVRMDTGLMGRMAAELLFKLIEGVPADPRPLLPVGLLRRGTL